MTTSLIRGARSSALSAITALTTVVALSLVACSSSEKPKPTPLEALSPQMTVHSAWSHKLDKVQFPLAVASAPDGSFVAASDDGTVVALRGADGRPLWRVSVGARIVAGVGSDGRLSAVVARDNERVFVR
jgi:outer membrane protein assembly factor BamB